MIAKLIIFFKGITGFDCIQDGSTCSFSKTWWDIHDYKYHKGGDGTIKPSKIYTCPVCKHQFH